MSYRNLLVCFVVASAAIDSRPAWACTNFLISKGASADGSTIITYSADSHTLYRELYYTPARAHAPGEMLDIIEWDTGKFLGRIKQVPWTYAVVGNMNEHQLTIGETTFGGRPELANPKGTIDYGSLMYIALQRAKTAREAIKVMTDLLAEYGYHSSGESFSIADTNKNRVRVINLTTGMIDTAIGKGTKAYSGDGGSAQEAELNRPFGVAFDPNGDLYVSDTFNGRIRKVKMN